MQLSEIYVYPIKSLGGIQLEKVQIEPRGLQNDRRFMLSTPEGMFLTQRKFRQMALLKTDLKNGKILVWHKDQPENMLEIPSVPTLFEKEQPVEIWGTTCIGQVMSKTINQWFQDQLKTDCQLVYMPDTADRRVKEKYSSQREILSFADGAPILVAGQASLDDLNNRLGSPVLMNRFRPNLVFSDGQPFMEDSWRSMKIARQTFKITHRCVRCNVPNINQENAQIEKEPNKTLATFRRFDQAIYFGVNAVWQKDLSIENEAINIGDVVNFLPQKPAQKNEAVLRNDEK